MPDVVKALVDGGQASAGPPLGPSLGPLGVNVANVVKAINEKTKAYQGMRVPVKIIVDPKTRDFTIEVGTPTTAALVLKEIGAEKGAGTPGKAVAGNLTMDGVARIAAMKKESMQGATPRARALEVIGTCVSLGVTVEGKPPREITAEVRAGKWDKKLGK